jgi:hypothetical protein
MVMTFQNPVLTVRLERELSGEMVALGLRGLAERTPGRTPDSTADGHELASHHLCVRVDGRPVALVRITLRSVAAVPEWSSERTPLAGRADVAELCGGVVVPAWRRVGLFRLSMLESLLRLRGLGAETAIARIEHDFCGRHFLGRLGFEPAGAPAMIDEPPGCGALPQCLRLGVSPALEERWHDLRCQQLVGLAEQGYLVDSDLPLARLVAGDGSRRS